MIGRCHELHADVGWRDVVDRRSSRFEHAQRSGRAGDVNAIHHDANTLGHRFDFRVAVGSPQPTLGRTRRDPLLHRRQRNPDSTDNRVMPLTLRFLGAAKTVTGSQYLLETDHAKVLIDCGMFQGTPEERIRNKVPFAYQPAELNAMLLTHAHLDHCGQIPRLVKSGFRGPIYATAGTIELAALVLLDSGKLQQEFEKREMRWERRHPAEAATEDQEQLVDYQAALALAAAGEALLDSPAIGPTGAGHRRTRSHPDRTGWHDPNGGRVGAPARCFRGDGRAAAGPR